MKFRTISISIFLILLISFSSYALEFSPEDRYSSVVVVYTDTSVGSGFAVKEDLLVTNAHVVEDNRKVGIKLYDGSAVKGQVIKADKKKDLALIRINKKIEPLEISREKLYVGQEVYAVGAPKAMSYSMTKGIISALDRELSGNLYIQVDASVNSGNSGGPLLDEKGQVIGVITLKASDAEGIGFAVGTEDLSAFIEETDISGALGLNNTEDQESEEQKDVGNDSDGEAKDDEGTEAFAAKSWQKLMTENDRLKIAMCISVILNIVLGFFCLYMLIKIRSAKKKSKMDQKYLETERDLFDFEIEIKE